MPKLNTVYDIGAAFESIENELISSMIRNMRRHKLEEIDEDKQWAMWQALQLKALEKYKKDNQKKYGKQFKDINAQIKTLISLSRSEGEMAQEIAILEAIRNGFPAKRIAKGAAAEFFKLNDRKLEALIKATMDDMEQAEIAVLRMANDQYRKVIYNAQVYANTGAGTYEKAVDMATEDFVKAGLNCVQYANGARHTLADYADMAIRTASKRAYLQGEGQKRQEWGISTVIMNKRGNPCPKCLPFVGKVLIDDVWSNGPKDGKSPVTGIKYPFMSSAIAAGLYHPRCKDSHTTYFEGISTPPEKNRYTKAELNELVRKQEQESRQQYAKRQEKKFGRLADFSLDPENQKRYETRRREWNVEAHPPFKPAQTMEEAQQYAQQFCKESMLDRVFKGKADYKGISLENANSINEGLNDIYSAYDIPKINGVKTIDPKSAKGKKIFTSEDAVMAYSPVENGIYINKAVLKNEKTLDDYNKKSKEAWEVVMDNIDTLEGNKRELAERYKAAGRSLIGDGSAKDYITHEMGHHIQWQLFDAKTINEIGEDAKKYAGKISGYATASKTEYFAESFAAYMKGQTDILDPKFVNFLDKKAIVKKARNGIMKKNEDTLKMDLQLFAESDIKNQESGSLKRAIRKYQKRIKEHENKLENPALYCSDWNDKMTCEQEGLKRHWKKEIRNFNQAIEDRVNELMERGDYND